MDLFGDIYLFQPAQSSGKGADLAKPFDHTLACIQILKDNKFLMSHKCFFQTEIINVSVLAFFDKYLKEIEDIDLVQKAKEYSEIEIVTNIDGIKD